MKTLYVGNLPYDVSAEDLDALFGQHGQVMSVKLIDDRITGKPRGFGFVEMEPEAAAKAITALDGTEFVGRTIRVNEARPRGARPPRRSW